MQFCNNFYCLWNTVKVNVLESIYSKLKYLNIFSIETWINTMMISEQDVRMFVLWTIQHLHHSHTWVQEDGSFGFFVDLLILVEVEIIRPIAQLCQVEIPSFERLRGKKKSVNETWKTNTCIDITNLLWNEDSHPHGDADGAVHVALV